MGTKKLGKNWIRELNVLHVLRQGPATAVQISERTGISRGLVHHRLKRMRADGTIVQDVPRGPYRLATEAERIQATRDARWHRRALRRAHRAWSGYRSWGGTRESAMFLAVTVVTPLTALALSGHPLSGVSAAIPAALAAMCWDAECLRIRLEGVREERQERRDAR